MRVCLPVVLIAAAWAVAAPVPAPKPNPDGFLVNESGLVWLGADGKELARIDGGCAALSPDGRSLACLLRKKGVFRSTMAILPRDGKGAGIAVPGVSINVGEGCGPAWSFDGKRLLVVEQKVGADQKTETTHRLFDLATRKSRVLELPEGHIATGWSKDGKRLLTYFKDDDATRVCWLALDGKGEPERLTSPKEHAYGAKLSPDGKRILFQAAPIVPAGKRGQARLYVMDLKTKKRKTLDEPGETWGYCWSRDGSSVAYTWQRNPVKGDGDAERTTWLITCKADGSDSKRIASRKYRPDPGKLSVTIHFRVVAWR